MSSHAVAQFRDLLFRPWRAVFLRLRSAVECASAIARESLSSISPTVRGSHRRLWNGERLGWGRKRRGAGIFEVAQFLWVFTGKRFAKDAIASSSVLWAVITLCIAPCSGHNVVTSKMPKLQHQCAALGLPVPPWSQHRW